MQKTWQARQILSIHRNWPSWLPHLLWVQDDCPRCHSPRFKAAELRPIDHILALLALVPVRCLFCWRRYYWFTLDRKNLA